MCWLFIVLHVFSLIILQYSVLCFVKAGWLLLNSVTVQVSEQNCRRSANIRFGRMFTLNWGHVCYLKTLALRERDTGCHWKKKAAGGIKDKVNLELGQPYLKGFLISRSDMPLRIELAIFSQGICHIFSPKPTKCIGTEKWSLHSNTLQNVDHILF